MRSTMPSYRLARGDVVIIRMADPGKVGIVEADVDAVFASYLIRIQPRADAITPYFSVLLPVVRPLSGLCIRGEYRYTPEKAFLRH